MSQGLCREWGYDECLLLVESTNKRARRLYSKLGYTVLPGGDEIDAPTLKVVDGAITDVRVRNVAMRRSLKPFPAGALENARPGDAIKLAGAGAAAYWVATHSGGADEPSLDALLSALQDSLGVAVPWL